MKSADLNEYSPHFTHLCVYDLSWGLGLHVPELWMSNGNFWELVLPHFWTWSCFTTSSICILQASWSMRFWMCSCLILLFHSTTAGTIIVYQSIWTSYVGPRDWAQGCLLVNAKAQILGKYNLTVFTHLATWSWYKDYFNFCKMSPFVDWSTSWRWSHVLKYVSHGRLLFFLEQKINGISEYVYF